MNTDQFGIQLTPNPDRTISTTINDEQFDRFPVRTALVNIGDSYIEFIKKYVMPDVKPGDFIAISEKVISICQKRVVHESEVHPTWLAKLICKFVTKYPNDVGFENPRKMQVAINEAGYPRMILAVIGGGFMKYVFGKRGYFYSIAGNDINAIDGFNPIAIPPFNQYAMLAPAHADETCDEIEKTLGVATTIVDASNIATAILGRSQGIPYSDDKLKQILNGNPMGQGDEQTPVIIIRKA